MALCSWTITADGIINLRSSHEHTDIKQHDLDWPKTLLLMGIQVCDQKKLDKLENVKSLYKYKVFKTYSQLNTYSISIRI